MKFWLLLGCCLLGVGSAVPVPGASAHIGSSPHALTRDEARRIDGWCEPSGPGFVAGVCIESRALYDILDPHGHLVDPAGVGCEDCRRALRENGYCEASRIGYVNGLAYLSRLGYLLALGVRIDPARLPCDVCRAHVESPGWCAACSRGLVGPVSYADREVFDRAVSERARLRRATLRVPLCEFCAVMAFTDGRCPRCRVVFRDGEPVQSAQAIRRVKESVP